MMRRRALLVSVATGLAAGAQARGDALRIIVAYPPGGVSDRMARLFAERLAPVLGIPVIVDNRAGAGGSVALSLVARAVPDERTLGFCAISPLALLPHFGTPAPAVVPVSGVMRTPLLVLGTPALHARDFQAVVREARQPGAEPLRWATSGIGTIGHLAVEVVRRELHLPVVHVPYSGGGPQLQDALAGRFELLSSNLAPLQIEYVRGGRLTALAVGAPRRSTILPQVPTFAELGCPDANVASLFGLFAPQGTAAEAVARMNAACAQVLAQPGFRRVLAEAGNELADGDAASFAKEIRTQDAANARAVEAMRAPPR
jgi:tripartite-type tricarboxylate transporter receptor subunit TctC